MANSICPVCPNSFVKFVPMALMQTNIINYIKKKYQLYIYLKCMIIIQV